MRALLFVILVSVSSVFGQPLEYQRQVQIPAYPAENIWELALQNADIGIRPADISAVAECLKVRWPNPILGEVYVVPDECLPGAPIQAVGSLDDLAVQAARLAQRKMVSGPSYSREYDSDYYQTRLQQGPGEPVWRRPGEYVPSSDFNPAWNWERGHIHAVQAGETLTSLRQQYGCPSRWSRVCDSAIVFENGLSQDGSLQVGQRLFIPPLGTYQPEEEILKFRINRGMTVYSLRPWIRETYGIFAEHSFLSSPYVHVNARNEFELHDIATGQVVTIYLTPDAQQKCAPQRVHFFKKMGWWEE